MNFGSEFLVIGNGEKQFALEDGKPVKDGKEVDLKETLDDIKATDPKICNKCKKIKSACSCDEEE